jgi:DNA-binding response OmpR family regulator
MDNDTKLLIVDDNVTLTSALQVYFEKAGYEVLLAADGMECLRKLYDQHPDLVILDLMLPKMDGWQVCQRIREICNVPIVMLTARNQQADRVMGLKMGADDYVSKPFSLQELEARLEAILRRARLSPPYRGRIIYNDGELSIDSDRSEVRLHGERVALTATELRLLLVLVENAGRVVTHRQLLEQIWGPEYTNEVDYTKLFICRLRQKIEANPGSPRYIVTERGLGYRFCRTSVNTREVA